MAVSDLVRTTLDRGGLGGVFFLSGEDAFRRDAAARALVEAHIDPATRDFNLDVLRGGETDVETLASITATPPMMAEYRVVVVHEMEALAQSSRARDLLVGLADSPPPGLCLVLLATIPQGSKAKIYATLRRTARALEFPAIERDDVPGWLMAHAREAHGVEMDEDAARALATGLGTDLGVLAQEVAKLAAMVDEGGRIGLAQVEAAGTRVETQDRWAWFDLVGEKRFREAVRTLPVLFAQGESGVGLAIGLSTHLLRLGLVATGGPQALEQALPPHQRWLAKRYAAAGRRWSAAEVERALLGLRRVDRLLKASGMSDQAHLEEWLLGLWAESEAAA
ncbi:MAG: DNA polymerase III subunit delta [Gemmatimonadetes bacterium]|nr:MAG: DNA polymerase III subunit delta [Gemmatimonadota bacterium]